MSELNYRKMVEDIDEIVEVDFAFEMETKLLRNANPYSQEEARLMAEMILKIYSIAHCTTCKACQRKYLSATTKDTDHENSN